MIAGARIGHWQLTTEAPGEPEVVRWRGVDTRTGAPVEVLALRRPPARDAVAEATFADVHRRLGRADDTAIVQVLQVEQIDGRAAVVRAPLEDQTLLDLAGPLPPPIVAAIGAKLVPAVLAAGGATGGALTPRDVGVDATGAPVLAPRGRPVSRLAPQDVRAVAPEAFGGGAADGAAGLYGLGVMLYRLATGRDPAPGAAPPSASSLRREIPGELDRALAALLSPEPARRADALPLLRAVAAPSADVRPWFVRGPKPATAVTGEVAVTRMAPSQEAARADARVAASHIDRARVAVVVPARLTARLDPAQRSAAAGWAELPEAAVERLAAANLPIVLANARTQAEARVHAERISGESGLTLDVVRPSGCGPWTLALGGLLVGPVVATVLVALGQPVLIPALMTTLVLAMALAWWGSTALAWRAARRAWLEAERLRTPPKGLDDLGDARARIAALRRRVTTAELPMPAKADLRSGLREVEDQLDALARIAQVADDALGTIDLDRLRTRLAGLSRASGDAASATERDRTARAIADLEEVASRREEARREIARVETALDEIEAVLGRVGGPLLTDAADAGADAVERLVRSTRLARASLDLDAERPRGGARRPIEE